MWGVHCEPSVARELRPSAERSGKPSAAESRAQRKAESSGKPSAAEKGISGVSPDTNKVIPHLKAHKARLAHLLLLILGQVLDLRRGYLGLEEGLGVGAFEL